MKTTTTFTADASKKICDVKKRIDTSNFLATILAYGTWGGGTITYYLSPDNGTTKVALKDLTGVAVTSTADDNVNTNLGSSDNSPLLEIWATLAGATNPSLTINVFDNR